MVFVTREEVISIEEYNNVEVRVLYRNLVICHALRKTVSVASIKRRTDASRSGGDRTSSVSLRATDESSENHRRLLAVS